MKENAQLKQNAKLLGHAFRGYSAKMMLTYLMSTMGSIVDSIIISRFLGTDAMAAFQIVAPLLLLNVVVGSLFSIGLQTACANCLGAGRVDEAGRVYTVTMLVLAPIALLFAAGVGLFAGPLAAMLCGPESSALAGGAAAYLRGVAPALGLGDSPPKPGPDRPFYLDIRLVGIPPLDPDFTPLSDKMATWKLRIRDNGPQFELAAWGALHDDKDPIKNPGIRAMTARSPDNTYTYTLGLNYLFVTL